MPSPLRRRITPFVPFVLKYTDESGEYASNLKIAYDWNSLALVELELGKNMLLDIGAVLDNPSIINVSVLLWAGLQIYHPEYEGAEGLEAVRSNLTIATAAEAKAKCSEAFVKQLPPEQVAAMEKAAAAAAAGQAAPPLEPSPVSAE